MKLVECFKLVFAIMKELVLKKDKQEKIEEKYVKSDSKIKSKPGCQCPGTKKRVRLIFHWNEPRWKSLSTESLLTKPTVQSIFRMDKLKWVGKKTYFRY